MEWQQCECGASWLGYYWERCDWCWNRQQIALEAYRKSLLQPEWLQKQGPRYWELSELDRAVWNSTRGIHVTHRLVDEWAIALADAFLDEIITEQELSRVLQKWTQLRESLPYSESSNIESQE